MGNPPASLLMVTILSITVRIDNVVDSAASATVATVAAMSTEITVRGSFAAFERPERGTVRATIAYDGPAMEPVYGRVARDLDAVKASIAPLDNKDNGPVTWWSTKHVATWSHRPWNQDGKQLPLVHHASVGVQVSTFGVSGRSPDLKVFSRSTRSAAGRSDVCSRATILRTCPPR